MSIDIPFPLIAFAALMYTALALPMAVFRLVIGAWLRAGLWGSTAIGAGWLFCALMGYL